jgi:hypothetical protein
LSECSLQGVKSDSSNVACQPEAEVRERLPWSRLSLGDSRNDSASFDAEQDCVGAQMSQDEEEVREPMDAEDQAIVAALSPMQIEAIDLAVMQEASARWSKVARGLGTFRKKRPGIPEDVPLEFIWERSCRLVAQGDLESQGDISQWGASEVRRVG